MNWTRPNFFQHPDSLVIGRTGPLPFFPKVRLTNLQRSTHTYVIGTTGQGKSKLLQNCLFQDIVAGRGCGVIDPHTDLVQDLLAQLDASGWLQNPDNRRRLVYLEPSRQEGRLPFNVLATPYVPYVTTMNIVEAFKRTWPESLREAPRFTNILQACLLTLIANHLSLVEISRLLMNKDWREELLEEVADPEVVAVFHDRMDRWGREQPLMLESILNKMSAFALNPILRQILGQRENHLDFRAIMDEGKVLLIDLGQCDGETRRLLGSLIVTGIEQAALSRKTDEKRSRRPFYFYIDEFQLFCANEGSMVSFAQILSESRKFGLSLTLTHQTLGQIQADYLHSALGNIGTKVVFSVDRTDAETLARKLFRPDGEQVKHEVPDEVQQDRMHPLFYSLQESWEQSIQAIQNLNSRTCLMKAPGKTVVKVYTISIPHQPLSLGGWERFLQDRRENPSVLPTQGKYIAIGSGWQPTFYEPVDGTVQYKSTRMSLSSGKTIKP